MVHYCNLLGLSVSLTNRHGNWFFGQVNLYIVSLNNTFNRLKKISLTNRWGLPVYFFLSLHWQKWTFLWDFNPCFLFKTLLLGLLSTTLKRFRERHTKSCGTISLQHSEQQEREDGNVHCSRSLLLLFFENVMINWS